MSDFVDYSLRSLIILKPFTGARLVPQAPETGLRQKVNEVQGYGINQRRNEESLRICTP